MNIAHYISNWWKEALEYKERVLKDGGITKREDNVQRYYQMCKEQGILNSIKFAWLGEAGGKFRDSGANRFWTKAYSLVTTNDATQTTSTSQPYLTGNIAPTERIGMKNPNGGSNYMTHPTISFAANEAWSVTNVVDYNGSGSGQSELWGDGIPHYYFAFKLIGVYSVCLLSETAVQSRYDTTSTIGKNNIITLSAIGDGSLSLYINGILVQYFTPAANRTSVFISTLLRGRNPSADNAFKVYSHIIRAQALTPSQVAAEANFLRTLYPEIPSVTIGSQVWATSNCEMVATPQGNLIANVTENANVEKITNAADREFSSDTGFWTKGTNVTIGSDVCHCASSPLGNIISKSAILTVNKWYKITYAVSNYVSGGVRFSSGGGVNGIIRNVNGTYTEYLYLNTTYLILESTTTTTLDIDNVSVQEVGWSGSTDLYNAIYAQTAGTDEQKTYAAVKAAGFWSYYNNDPALGAVYGKLYNWYAVKLLQMDIDYYNAANPTTPWGWRVPTDTDFNTLATTLGGASVAGGKMKKDGLVYWLTPNTGADNSSGFSAIGVGYRNNTGTFTASTSASYFTSITEYSAANSYSVYVIYNSDDLALNQSNTKIIGFPLRLIKS